MVNMDLPWNPMQIEQRLGRLHQVGQEYDMLLTSLVTSGTIEEQIPNTSRGRGLTWRR
jgi:SNF2 family DNA or RNA helicase